jgi:hypothetical protein
MKYKEFLIILFGSMAAVYAVQFIAESLIRKGAMQLDRDTLDRVWKTEARRLGILRGVETLSFFLLLAGLAMFVGLVSVPYRQFWSYGCIAVGIAFYCGASILRSWNTRAAYAAEAPNSKASSGARTGAILTTMAEFVLGGAVCFYVFTHVNYPPSLKNLASSPPANTATSTSTGTNSTPPPAPAPQNSEFIGEADAVKLLGKDVKFLKALADHSYVLSSGRDGATQYNRDDIIKLKRDGFPSNDELELNGDTSQK